MVLTPEQWQQLGFDLGRRLAAERAAATRRHLLVAGALAVLAQELAR